MSAQNGDASRIVVGADGSPSSRAALRWAVRQAELTGATVQAVIAWQYPVATGGYAWAPVAVLDGADLQEAAEKALADEIGEVVGGSSSSDVRVRPAAIEGNPSQVLIEASAGADLLVVGSRGHGGFAGALLGSVSQHCVHHADCPVVIVRAG
jgi:nucleotide-binding universal stress UspA family protein